jgi:hypothetical protein
MYSIFSNFLKINYELSIKIIHNLKNKISFSLKDICNESDETENVCKIYIQTKT